MNRPIAEAALRFMHDALLHSRIDLAGPWSGWKLRGRELVSPEGDRISERRLARLLEREWLHRSCWKNVSRPSGVVVPFRPRRTDG